MPLDNLTYGTHYEVRLVHPTGYYVDYIDDYLSLDYTLVVNDIGVLTIVLPSNHNMQYIVADARIEVWRSVGQRPAKLEGDTQWFITKIVEEVDDGGMKTYKAVAQSAICLLQRRIVAYYGDSGYDYGALAADNFMKLIVNQNYGSAALNTARNVSTYLSVDANASAGPTIYASFAWKEILETLRDIANAAYQVGTAVYFDVVATAPPSGLTFRTFTTQRGTDRRVTSANALLVGPAYGSIGSYTLVTDYTDEGTIVYAGGAGEDSNQLVTTLEDASRSNRGPLGRKEVWVDANKANTLLQLTGAAQSALIALRPRQVFQGKLLNTPGTIYSVHWGFGDYLTAQTTQGNFDCRVVGVHVAVQPATSETIDAVLRSDI